jgi:transcriptional regulator with XRE-family HTH domain
MARAPIGQRIRKRRQELAKSQKDLAAEIGISPSYLNLIEHNKRAIGGALAHRIAAGLNLDSRSLSGTEEARLIAEIEEISEEPALAPLGIGPGDAARIVSASDMAARDPRALPRLSRLARPDLIGERLGEPSFLTEAGHRSVADDHRPLVRGDPKDYGDLTDEERRRFMATLSDESDPRAAPSCSISSAAAAGTVGLAAGGGRGLISDRANYFPRLEAARRTRASLSLILRRRSKRSCAISTAATASRCGG